MTEKPEIPNSNWGENPEISAESELPSVESMKELINHSISVLESSQNYLDVSEDLDGPVREVLNEIGNASFFADLIKNYLRHLSWYGLTHDIPVEEMSEPEKNEINEEYSKRKDFFIKMLRKALDQLNQELDWDSLVLDPNSLITKPEPPKLKNVNIKILSSDHRDKLSLGNTEISMAGREPRLLTSLEMEIITKLNPWRDYFLGQNKTNKDYGIGIIKQYPDNLKEEFLDNLEEVGLEADFCYVANSEEIEAHMGDTNFEFKKNPVRGGWLLIKNPQDNSQFFASPVLNSLTTETASIVASRVFHGISGADCASRFLVEEFGASAIFKLQDDGSYKLIEPGSIHLKGKERPDNWPVNYDQVITIAPEIASLPAEFQNDWEKINRIHGEIIKIYNQSIRRMEEAEWKDWFDSKQELQEAIGKIIAQLEPLNFLLPIKAIIKRMTVLAPRFYSEHLSYLVNRSLKVLSGYLPKKREN